jgi:hypothetical protein
MKATDNGSQDQHRTNTEPKRELAPHPDNTNTETQLDEILADLVSKVHEAIVVRDDWDMKEEAYVEAKAAINTIIARERLDSLLQQAIDASGNEFSMGYDDSGCFWRFYYGSRGAGSMMEGWPTFNSESPEPLEALREFINALKNGEGKHE